MKKLMDDVDPAVAVKPPPPAGGPPARRRLARVLTWLKRLAAAAAALGVLGLLGAWALIRHYEAELPSVAVREVQVHPREHDLVIATHGRGIWIVDDISPLRALSPDLLERPAAFVAGRPVQQRIPARAGGWVQGDAAFVGPNPPSGAVITYYQSTRHLFGPIRLEVFDAAGKLIETIPATKRRGLNRVSWSMQVPPPRVPRAASLAFGASQGPRVVPGSYTVRLTKGAEVIETKLEVGLDRRASYTAADRQQQFDAAMRVQALFGRMSDAVDRIEGARRQIDAGPKASRLEELKKKIVATKEGGAVTGEERLREHADAVYGAIMSWEGRPARYQVERIEALERELGDVEKELDGLLPSGPR